MVADAALEIGDGEGARRLLDHDVPPTALDAAETAESRFDLDFALTCQGNWQEWEEAVERIAPEQQRRHRVMMALYRAALALRDGSDWRSVLESAYAKEGPFAVPVALRVATTLGYAANILGPIAVVGLVEAVFGTVR